MGWLIENLGTIIALAILIAVILLIAVKLIKDKKKGKLSCGCNCAYCAMTSSCHEQDEGKACHQTHR